MIKLILGDEVGEFRRLFTESKVNNDLIATPKISPSGLHCQVAVWYKLHKTPMLPEFRNFENDGYASSGSDRHKVIQNFLSNSGDIEWVDISKYVSDHNLPFDVEYEKEVYDLAKKYDLFEEQVCEILGSKERLLKHKNNLINFKLDGIIKFKGEYYIIEIKTTSDAKAQKAPLEEHQLQGKCYSMLLGIKKIIWIYESRERFTHTIAFQEMQDSDIEYIRGYLNEIVTADSPLSLSRASDCKNCRYREKCFKDFENDRIF